MDIQNDSCYFDRLTCNVWQFKSAIQDSDEGYISFHRVYPSSVQVFQDFNLPKNWEVIENFSIEYIENNFYLLDSSNFEFLNSLSQLPLALDIIQKAYKEAEGRSLHDLSVMIESISNQLIRIQSLYEEIELLESWPIV